MPRTETILINYSVLINLLQKKIEKQYKMESSSSEDDFDVLLSS